MSPGKIIDWSGAIIVASIAGFMGLGFLIIFVEVVKNILN